MALVVSPTPVLVNTVDTLFCVPFYRAQTSGEGILSLRSENSHLAAAQYLQNPLTP